MNSVKIMGDISCIPYESNSELELFFDKSIFLKEGFYSIAINAEKLVRCDENESFAEVVAGSKLPIPDGVSALLFLKRLGYRAKKLDLPSFVIDYCSRRHVTLGIVGASQESNDKAVLNIKENYPGIEIKLSLNGYVNNDEIVDALVASGSDIILLGLGSPRQEFLSRLLHERFEKMIIINCGGAIDVLSGKVNRAPDFIQRLNLEWLYRLCTQPRRIVRYVRLFKIIPLFIKLKKS
ncbi:MAG: WecB/TagA/CpsF family glycosyltransferase [Bacteroidetes bacterium]|nr:WecB/TagA/CpsF family glycosyltransferase [Bacteroidota bacterium]MDA1126859.1 WecB/TagA/CpsF family glycosyltransferase [Bacteroidota bacterium]